MLTYRHLARGGTTNRRDLANAPLAPCMIASVSLARIKPTSARSTRRAGSSGVIARAAKDRHLGESDRDVAHMRNQEGREVKSDRAHGCSRTLGRLAASIGSSPRIAGGAIRPGDSPGWA
jgi:hypothetical protein